MGLTDREVRELAVQLARENELLRLRVLEITDFAEEAVAKQVGAEREVVIAKARLQAILGSRPMRVVRRLRHEYRRLIKGFGREP